MRVNIFYDDGIAYIQAPVRSGLLQLVLDKDTSVEFLVDINKTGRKKKTTVYKFIGIVKTSGDTTNGAH